MLYENFKTLGRELRIAKTFKDAVIRPLYGPLAAIKKLRPEDRIDYRVSCGPVTCGYCEVRWRDPRNEHWPTWFLDAAKLNAAFEICEFEQVQFWIVFGWGPRCYFAPVTRGDVIAQRPGGRSDRHDPFDADLMGHLPRQMFQLFHTFPNDP